MKKNKRLLIIPAKSISTRIKNKNFKSFLGKPIILYSYNSAVKSKLFDKIHISTESNNVKKKLGKYKIHIDFLRTKKLTLNNTGLFDVYKYVYKEYKKRNLEFDEIWTLLPCAPLIEAKDLINLNKCILQKKIKKPIISVCRYPAPVEWAFIMNSQKKLFPVSAKKQSFPSQKFRETFYDVGVLSVFDTKNFEKFKSSTISHNFSGYELEFHKSVDIDDYADWKFSEKLFKVSI